MTAKAKVFCIVLQAVHALDFPHHEIFRFNVVNIHIFSTSYTPVFSAGLPHAWKGMREAKRRKQ